MNETLAEELNFCDQHIQAHQIDSTSESGTTIE
jgi:hypothetical protein